MADAKHTPVIQTSDYVGAGRDLFIRWRQHLIKFVRSADEWSDLEMEDRDAWSMLAIDLLGDQGASPSPSPSPEAINRARAVKISDAIMDAIGSVSSLGINEANPERLASLTRALNHLKEAHDNVRPIAKATGSAS